MFIETWFVIEVVSSIFQKGKIEVSEPIFQEFNKFLETLDLDVAFTTFLKQPKKKIISGNSSENGNDITVYIKTTDIYKKLGFTDEGNWGGGYRNTEIIKEKWKELAKKYGYDISYYDYIAHVFVCDFQKFYLYRLLMNSKAEAEQYIKKKKWRITPEFMFGSSEPPCYRIIYENEKDYEWAKRNGCFDEITKFINNMLTKNDFLNMFTKGLVGVEYYHADMKLNLHGMSRED
ncbi:MAG: hypothetical protein AAB221_03835 [Bacteroidota bacterium]